VSVSGPMVQEYAKKVVEKLGKTKFKISNGWLESFHKGHHMDKSLHWTVSILHNYYSIP
jgi:hypothetical protein